MPYCLVFYCAAKKNKDDGKKEKKGFLFIRHSIGCFDFQYKHYVLLLVFQLHRVTEQVLVKKKDSIS